MMRKVISAQRRRNWVFTSGCNKPEKGEQIVNVFKNTYAKATKTVDLNSEYVSQR